MRRKLVALLIFVLTLFALTACEIPDEVKENADVLYEKGKDYLENELGIDASDLPGFDDKQTIAGLEQTERFDKGALEHIFLGEINGSGKAVGFHYEDMLNSRGKVIEGTKTENNAYGVYEAKVKVDGVEKTSNSGKSTFFPKSMTAQEVVNAINEAYDNKELVSGNEYSGKSSKGMQINMYINEDNDKIVSAFPIY